MKKIMSLVLAVTLLMSVFGGLTAFAADATSIPKDYTVEGAVADGNDAYGWKVDGTTLKIYYTGNPVDYKEGDYTNRPWQGSVKTIEEVVIEGTPTEIGERTFKDMKALKKVTYSDEAKKTVTKIKTEAFMGTGINGVFRIPASVTYLHGQSIQSLRISALVFESSTTEIELYKGLPYLGDLTSIVLMRPAKITGSITTVKQFGGKYTYGTYGMTAPSRINMLISNASYIEPFSKLADYKDYLKSLEMKAVIAPFEAMYMARIAQLTNKSNQFNLTTKRFSQSEIETIAQNPQFITLYGKLEDKFGDNGVVSVVIGEKEENALHIRLWLMSCRVLKRDMEFAMMDTLVEACKQQGLSTIYGYYYPTAKNAMVKEFYSLQGFEKTAEDDQGNTTWQYTIPADYQYKNEVINRG